jgi:hypothetical protein
MLKFKMYIRRFAPSPVRVLDKFPHGERFFSPYGKTDKQWNRQNSILFHVTIPSNKFVWLRGAEG